MEVLPLVLTPAFVLAIVELVKRLGLPGKYLPVAAVVIGGGLGLTFQLYGQNELFSAAVGGVLFGLSAVGLWEFGDKAYAGVKAVVADDAQG